MNDYYEILGLSPGASPDDIKRAFREQIARYHPDKLHHLGREFQQLAQTRAAELTEAYSTLSDRARRAEYDRVRTAGMSPAPEASPAPPGRVETPVRPEPPPPVSPPPPASTATKPPEHRAERARPDPRGSVMFSQELAGRDELVRRASIVRLREACKDAMGDFEASPAAGFDLSCHGKGGFFGRLKSRPWVLGRYLPRMDADALREVGESAARLSGNGGATRCVFLLSGHPGRVSDLTEAITGVRRRAQARAGCDVLLIPVDVRNWQAYLPKDAPSLARAIVTRLQG